MNPSRITAPSPAPSLSRRTPGLLGFCTVALLAACAAPVATPPPSATAPAASTPPPATAGTPPARTPTLVSQATTPREYRRDGARHLYDKYPHRIYKGKLPPLLQGVGTMQLELDQLGEIVAMNWMRAPSHPGAKAEIERAVREAAPYPAPVRMGRVVYTDTWLWDKSGNFQLDTLTEGQRDR